MKNFSPTFVPLHRCVPKEDGGSLSPGWQALSLPTIESKPKRVVRDENFSVAIDLIPAQERDYVRLVSLIRVGGDLSRYYRKSATADHLLLDLQVIHLHLGGPGSDAILYAVQYPEHVLFVRIDSHIHLDDLPPGRRLNPLGRRKFEAGLQAEAEEKTKAVAKGVSRWL